MFWNETRLYHYFFVSLRPPPKYSCAQNTFALQTFNFRFIIDEVRHKKGGYFKKGEKFQIYLEFFRRVAVLPFFMLGLEYFITI